MLWHVARGESSPVFQHLLTLPGIASEAPKTGYVFPTDLLDALQDAELKHFIEELR
jgi:hypothetical protein